MTINLDSTSDSKEAVTAALGESVSAKTVEEKSEESVGETDPKEEEVKEPDESEEESAEDPADDEETDAEEKEAATLEDETQKGKPKKKGGWRRQIEKREQTISTLEQEKEYWRQEALRAQKNPAEQSENAIAKPDLSKRPKADDFETNDAYVEALTDWKLETKLAADRQRQRDDAIKNEAQTRIGKHNERVNAFKESHDDFEDVLENVAKIPMSLSVQETIIESDLGPEVMYELAKNPKEFARICALKPLAAAKEIGKIETRLSKPASEIPPEKKTTKAPAPVTPVRTRGASVVKDLYKAESMTQREWNQLREEQIRSARR